MVKMKFYKHTFSNLNKIELIPLLNESEIKFNTFLVLLWKLKIN